MSGVRLVMGSVFQNRDAGKDLALEVLKAGAATGGDVVELVLVEAEHADRGGGVAAPDDGEAPGVLHRLGDGLGAGGEGVELEDAHGAVPHDRLRVGDLLGEEAAGV